jgi:hypothetical protein
MGLLRRSQWVTYLPAYGGNRARAEAGLEPHPITVQLRLPTWRELRAPAFLGRPRTPEDDDAFLADHIGAIAHLALEPGSPDGPPVPIPDGKTLLALADQVDGDFLAELNLALNDAARLHEGLKKSSPPPPGSAVPPSAGTAGTAAREASTS